MRKKITRLMIITSIIVIAIVSIITIVFNYNQTVQNTLEDNQKIANAISLNIDNYFEEIANTVLTIAGNETLKEALLSSNSQLELLSESNRQQYITDLNEQWKESDINDPFIQDYLQNEPASVLKKQQEIIPARYGEIFLTDKYGKLVASTGKLTTLAHESKYWWQASYSEGVGRIFFDDRGYDESVQGYVIGIVVPIYDQNDIIGILKCNINIMSFFEQVSNDYQKAYAPNIISIARTSGIVVYEDGVDPLSKQLPSDYLQGYNGTDTSSIQENENKEKTLISVSQIVHTSGTTEEGFGGNYESVDHIKGNSGESWVVLYTMEKSLVNSQYLADTWIFILLGILLLMMVSVFIQIATKSIIKPLEKLTEFTNEVGQGNFNQTIDINTNDEIEVLATSFNNMVTNLKNTTTSKKQLEEEIKKRTAIENEKNMIEAHLRETQKLESINILASGVAHEINNPINGIMNYGQLIQDSSNVEESSYLYASEIIYETKRVTKIVKDLLLFSRQDKIQYHDVEMKDVINDTLSLIKTILRHDQISITVAFEKDLPTITCSVSQIQQVVMNMITNARDALNDKFEGFHDNKKIAVNCVSFEQEGKKWVRVSVKDYGNGISDEIRESMFTPFYTTKGRDRGTGLGLFISYGIVNEHHGVLSVETIEGEYTIMHIDLPVTQPV